MRCRTNNKISTPWNHKSITRTRKSLKFNPTSIIWRLNPKRMSWVTNAQCTRKISSTRSKETFYSQFKRNLNNRKSGSRIYRNNCIYRKKKQTTNSKMSWIRMAERLASSPKTNATKFVCWRNSCKFRRKRKLTCWISWPNSKPNCTRCSNLGLMWMNKSRNNRQRGILLGYNREKSLRSWNLHRWWPN